MPYSGEKIVDLGTDYGTYEIEFQMKGNSDTKSVLSISMGAVGDTQITEKHRVCIDNINLEKIDAPTVSEEAKAETPATTKQPAKASYAYGQKAKALTVKASVKDGGALSYQWYQNNKNSCKGATAVKGANQASYTPSTASVGTKYYYCVVTNTDRSSGLVKTAEESISLASVQETKAANKISGVSGSIKKSMAAKHLH